MLLALAPCLNFKLHNSIAWFVLITEFTWQSSIPKEKQLSTTRPFYRRLAFKFGLHQVFPVAPCCFQCSRHQRTSSHCWMLSSWIWMRDPYLCNSFWHSLATLVNSRDVWKLQGLLHPTSTKAVDELLPVVRDLQAIVSFFSSHLLKICEHFHGFWWILIWKTTQSPGKHRWDPKPTTFVRCWSDCWVRTWDIWTLSFSCHASLQKDTWLVTCTDVSDRWLVTLNGMRVGTLTCQSWCKQAESSNDAAANLRWCTVICHFGWWESWEILRYWNAQKMYHDSCLVFWNKASDHINEDQSRQLALDVEQAGAHEPLHSARSRYFEALQRWNMDLLWW